VRIWQYVMKNSERLKVKEKILELIEAGSNLTAAARACGISRETLRLWRKTDAVFGCRIGTLIFNRQLDRLEAKLGIV